MLTLLFNAQFWITLLVCLALAGVVILFALKPKSRPYIIAIVCGVIVVTSAINFVRLDRYYSAQGGIRGIFSSIVNGENKGEVSDNSVSLNNVVLTLNEEGNYSATIIPQNNLVLDAEETYTVFVNGLPCGYAEVNPDYIFSTYEYNFYDKNQAYTTDTLEIYFTMDKQTKVEVLTRGGSEMVKYWNYYFNRNDFVITIKETSSNFSYKEPTNTTSVTDSELVNTIIEKNDLALLKSLDVTFPEGYSNFTEFDSLENLQSIVSVVEAVIENNENDFTLISKNNEEISSLNCFKFEKMEDEYCYAESKTGSVTTGNIKYVYFTWYSYCFYFGSEDSYICLKIDYNPETDLNSFVYMTKFSGKMMEFTSDCNYFQIDCTGLELVNGSSLYFLQGSLVG